MIVYELTIEDMTTLGHMGSRPTTIFCNLYSSLGVAQAHAKIHYQKDIKWTKRPSGTWSSGDLRHVMYSIRLIEIID